ncbi:hypothetical protein CSO01_01310 [Cellulomonas soli]|uniref:Uncharacterized protein n=1 Tax=Cellulomonas soli TaxID=931535 RepID=A0A512P892_9CELL|nr:hypothetical protein CSO01_01310 [Cellulomonas soli]
MTLSVPIRIRNGGSDLPDREPATGLERAERSAPVSVPVPIVATPGPVPDAEGTPDRHGTPAWRGNAHGRGRAWDDAGTEARCDTT